MRFLLYSPFLLIVFYGFALGSETQLLEVKMEGAIEVEPKVTEPLHLPTKMRFKIHYQSLPQSDAAGIPQMIRSELAVILMAVDSDHVYLDSTHSLSSQTFDSRAAASRRATAMFYHMIMGLLPRPTTVQLSIDSAEIKRIEGDTISVQPTEATQITVTIPKLDDKTE